MPGPSVLPCETVRAAVRRSRPQSSPCTFSETRSNNSRTLTPSRSSLVVETRCDSAALKLSKFHLDRPDKLSNLSFLHWLRCLVAENFYLARPILPPTTAYGCRVASGEPRLASRSTWAASLETVACPPRQAFPARGSRTHSCVRNAPVLRSCARYGPRMDTRSDCRARLWWVLGRPVLFE